MVIFHSSVKWFWGIRSGIVLDHDLKFRISIEFNLLSTDLNLLSIDFPLKASENQLKRTNSNWFQFSYFQLILHLFTSHRDSFLCFWRLRSHSSKMKANNSYTAIPKKGIKGFMNKSHQEKVGHNRSPHQRTYYWRSELLIGYPLKKCLGVFFLRVLIRNSMLQEIWHICFSWIKQNH